MRCDRVDFPPGRRGLPARPPRSGHPAPAVRGADDHDRRLHHRLPGGAGPGSRAAPEPVYAESSAAEPSAFVRVMLLPAEWAGRRTIRYTDPRRRRPTGPPARHGVRRGTAEMSAAPRHGGRGAGGSAPPPRGGHRLHGPGGELPGGAGRPARRAGDPYRGVPPRVGRRDHGRGPGPPARRPGGRLRDPGGRGATHASVAVHNASMSGTALLLFIGPGAHPRTGGRRAFQEVDFEAFFGPLAKWSVEVDDPGRLSSVAAEAARVARDGRPGPVVVSLPEDVLAARVSVADAPVAPPPQRPAPSPEELAELRALLVAASRPLVIVGGGTWSAATGDALAAWAGRNHLPVAVTFRPPGLHRQRLARLRGLRRGRHAALLGAAHPGRRPDRGDRHPAGRHRNPGLHRSGAAGPPPDARAHPPRPRGVGQRLRAAPGDPRGRPGDSGRAGRAAAAGGSTLAGLDRGRPRRLRGVAAPTTCARSGGLRRGGGLAGRSPAPRGDPHQRRRQLLAVAPALLPLQAVRNAVGFPERGHGLRHPGCGGRQAARTPPGRR